MRAQILEQTVRNKTQWLLIAALAGLLIIVFWYSVAVWQATPSMPLYGNIILGVAMTLAVVAGCGLTALMYHSRRKGYDEPARAKKKAEDEAEPL
jgi:FtsH-binding integral membrane protein